jgi:hypothetical protein
MVFILGVEGTALTQVRATIEPLYNGTAHVTLCLCCAFNYTQHKNAKNQKSLKSLLKNLKNKNAFLRLFHTKVGQMFIYFIF